MTDGAGGATGAALPGTYEVVRALLADLPPGRILDAPCGEGHLAISLQAAGHRVVGGDLTPQRMAHAGLPALGLDLNARLPFRDGSFDGVVAIEGIEHLEDPYHLAREFSRVLRPDGLLILSTPNILNLRSRAKFLALGTFYWFDEEGYRRGFHVNAIPMYELRHILTEAGFAVDGVRVNRRPLGMRAAAALVGPLLRLVARDGGRPDHPNAGDLLAGEVLLVRARKRSAV
jgi:SAM-dependent methyltransferase